MRIRTNSNDIRSIEVIKMDLKGKLEKDELPAILDVLHIQKFLGIGKMQAYDLCKSKEFHIVRVGRRIKVDREVFLQWLEGNEQTQVN